MIQKQITPDADENKLFIVILISPILPGKSELWRRQIQEMRDTRRAEYEASRRQLGISRERVWIIDMLQGQFAVTSVTAARPEETLIKLINSDLPFDRWYREQLLTLHGLNFTRLPLAVTPELVLAWPET